MAAGMLLVSQRATQPREMSMFIILFFILLVIWLLGLVAFHVAGGFIHLLLIFAIIALVVHFFRGRRAI